MSITDELRQVAAKTEEANGRCGKLYRGDLDRIADRIDAEHKHAIAYVDDRDPETMAEHGWIKLPVDADGMLIRVGDVMEWPTTGETFEVVGLGDGVLFYVEDGEERADWTEASTKRHHHPPTVEDVLAEFADRVCNSGHQWGLDAADTIAEYAAKLRLKEDE